MPFYTVQHKRSDEIQRRPSPSDLADGQVAINYNINSAGLFFKTDDDEIIKVGPPVISDFEPVPVNYTELSIGESWVDTGGVSPVLKIWSGTQWLEVGTPAEFSQSLVPSTDCSYDLGTPTQRWGNLYTCDINMSNEGLENEVDGTWGSYVIQEGEEDLFLLNRRSGKKFKFMLQEVN